MSLWICTHVTPGGPRAEVEVEASDEDEARELAAEEFEGVPLEEIEVEEHRCRYCGKTDCEQPDECM